jgi:thiol-disulfide isomerase/thioredoxin
MSFNEKDLYGPNDPVTVLHDGCFIGTNLRIKKKCFLEHGLIKVYAPWCGHCQAKVKCMNKLAGILEEYGVTVYVINADNNPIFHGHFKDRIRGFPTFLEVSDRGTIGQPMTDKDGEQAYTVPAIISSLCGNDKRICQYMDSMGDCS